MTFMLAATVQQAKPPDLLEVVVVLEIVGQPEEAQATYALTMVVTMLA